MTQYIFITIPLLLLTSCMQDSNSSVVPTNPIFGESSAGGSGSSDNNETPGTLTNSSLEFEIIAFQISNHIIASDSDIIELYFSPNSTAFSNYSCSYDIIIPGLNMTSDCQITGTPTSLIKTDVLVIMNATNTDGTMLNTSKTVSISRLAKACSLESQTYNTSQTSPHYWGNGTQDNPYIICNSMQFIAIDFDSNLEEFYYIGRNVQFANSTGRSFNKKHFDFGGHILDFGSAVGASSEASLMNSFIDSSIKNVKIKGDFHITGDDMGNTSSLFKTTSNSVFKNILIQDDFMYESSQVSGSASIFSIYSNNDTFENIIAAPITNLNVSVNTYIGPIISTFTHFKTNTLYSSIFDNSNIFISKNLDDITTDSSLYYLIDDDIWNFTDVHGAGFGIGPYLNPNYLLITY